MPLLWVNDSWPCGAGQDFIGCLVYRVLGGEARVFFRRTGLPFGELSKVWRAAKAAAPAPGEGLTPQQFTAALRVVAAAQASFHAIMRAVRHV